MNRVPRVAEGDRWQFSRYGRCSAWCSLLSRCENGFTPERDAVWNLLSRAFTCPYRRLNQRCFSDARIARQRRSRFSS